MMLSGLAGDLADAQKRGWPKLDAILVTGDVAHAGGAEQYADAARWIGDVAKAAGVGKERVYVVPGNHDADFTVQDRNLGRLLDALRRGDDRLDDALEHERELLAKPLANYLAFASGLAPGCGELCWVQKIDAPSGLHVRLVGLDTALLTRRGDNRGKLRVGKAQLAAGLEGLQPEELVVVLSHHPFRQGWLADEAEADAWVRNHAHVHLFAHAGRPDTEVARGGEGGAFVRVATGIALDDPAGRDAIGYDVAAVVRAANGSLALRIWPRRWSARATSFRPDVDVLPEGSAYVEHPLRLALPRPTQPAGSANAPPSPGHAPMSDNRPHAPVDFLLFAPLEEERDALLSKLPGYRKLDADGTDVHVYFEAEVATRRQDNAVYRVIVTSPARVGPIHAAITATTATEHWRPEHVIVVGIAGGLKDEVRLGDVMVAQSVADYTVGKVREDGAREERWEMYPADIGLLNAANAFRTGWESFVTEPRPEDEGKPARHAGVIASGGDVIASRDLIAAYRGDMPKLIGVEMEGGGVAAALHGHRRRPRFLIIRGVSDLADGEGNAAMKKRWRAYARDVAAAYALGLLMEGPVPAARR